MTRLEYVDQRVRVLLALAEAEQRQQERRTAARARELRRLKRSLQALSRAARLMAEAGLIEGVALQ